jgi:hypothetical protein
VSGVRKIQRTEHRKQMTEDKERTVSAFCHLTSVICYLTPDTIDIVLFKELNWAKIYHTTFVTFL